jgi:hypothetical protein
MDMQSLLAKIASDEEIKVTKKEASKKEEDKDEKEYDKKDEDNEDEESEKEASIDKFAEDLYAAGAIIGRGVLDYIIKQAAATAMNYSAPGHPSNDPSEWVAKAKKIQSLHSDGPSQTVGKSNPGDAKANHSAGNAKGAGPEIWEGFPKRGKK